MWPPARWATTPGCPYNFGTISPKIPLVRDRAFSAMMGGEKNRSGGEPVKNVLFESRGGLSLFTGHRAPTPNYAKYHSITLRQKKDEKANIPPQWLFGL
jgi:hypothetical protein